jgi:hypothetical protein
MARRSPRDFWKRPRRWFDDEHELVRFELEARRRYPLLRRERVGRGRKASVAYEVPLPVESYGITRKVRIRFAGQEPRVFVDGPTDSPHRYLDGSLCMWHPHDPSSRRWTWSDGLVPLFGYIMIHLFREEWWRVTDDWLGPEAEHEPVKLGGGSERR